ncbi:MAG: MotA/TolQ/ExbB proton channel family protein [Planctomycetes bacterium]|nr:MotA/TolQ/ExbB proton channel family protein [Planctomycetota bacterium]
MNALEHLLHEATTLLMVPVVLTLLGLLAWTLLATGGFLRELRDRRAAGPDHGLVARFHRQAQALGTDRNGLESLADRCEVEGGRMVTRLNLVARAGPTLGLMATLIPMGPALLALGEDDVAQLARSLVVAFTATVVGLLVGLLCAVMGSVRRQWYAADLVDVDAWLAAHGEDRA